MVEHRVEKDRKRPTNAAEHPGGDGYADVIERLFAAYETKHTLDTIAAVTARSRTDLQGQIHPESQAELLERLARARLDALDATR